MRLLVTTPTTVVLDTDEVSQVRAEDETGAFGILPGHADLITVLSVSVLTWRNTAGGEHHIAVRGGVLTVRGGSVVEVATRQAVGEETLERLGPALLEELRDEALSEQEARVSATRLQVSAIRHLQRYLEAGQPSIGRSPAWPASATGHSSASSAIGGDGDDAER